MSHTELASIIRFVPINERLASAGQPTEAQLAQLAAAGYEVIINLGLHTDKRYALDDEAGAVRALGMQYIHIPIQFAAPTLDDLSRFFEEMEELGQRKTLVHCAHNKRVSVFIALHRILRGGWDAEEALRAMRATWEPDEVWCRFIHNALTQAPVSGGA